ncbi:hypothetical protein BRADI_1g13973v3 [Brachypodium distachyon]|uniref:Uncharacterized protein n=1 Tax=Brachypodium distachyon TaxID=15368 RepID=A0A2K2DJD7_BRADI|nr:hypothetical protein BRADI_1g13973v3 [Brachypodium distachyon]
MGCSILPYLVKTHPCPRRDLGPCLPTLHRTARMHVFVTPLGLRCLLISDGSHICTVKKKRRFWIHHTYLYMQCNHAAGAGAAEKAAFPWHFVRAHK